MNNTETPPAWVRLLAGALLVSALTFVAVQFVNRAVIPPLLIQAVVAVPLAYAVLRWHRRRWVLILATVVPLLALAGGFPFYVEDLVHPESGWAFVPSVLMVIALLVAFAAGLAALLHRSEAPARPFALGAAALGIALTVVGLIATLGVEDDARAEGDLEVVAKNVEFPETVAARAGDVTLYVVNKDLVRHTLVIEHTGTKVELPGSANRRVTVSLQPGAYEYHCDVPGHEAMKGTIEVK